MSNYPSLRSKSLGTTSVNRVRPYQDTTMKTPTLRQRIINWLQGPDQYSDMAIASEDYSINSNGMRFTLYKASGGFVIETRIYDDRNDRTINKLHVITEEMDLGESLGKIITMESLR